MGIISVSDQLFRIFCRLIRSNPWSQFADTPVYWSLNDHLHELGYPEDLNRSMRVRLGQAVVEAYKQKHGRAPQMANHEHGEQGRRVSLYEEADLTDELRRFPGLSGMYAVRAWSTAWFRRCNRPQPWHTPGCPLGRPPARRRRLWPHPGCPEAGTRHPSGCSHRGRRLCGAL